MLLVQKAVSMSVELGSITCSEIFLRVSYGCAASNDQVASTARLIIPCQRMVFENKLSEAFIKHVRVNLGCGNICVPQQCLNGTQVSAICQKMSGKGMAQGVRCYFFRRNTPATASSLIRR